MSWRLTLWWAFVVLLIFGGARDSSLASITTPTGVDPEHGAFAAPIAMLIGLCSCGSPHSFAAPALIGGWGLIKGKSLVTRSG